MKHLESVLIIAVLILGLCSCSYKDQESYETSETSGAIDETGLDNGQIEKPAIYYQGNLYSYNFQGFQETIASRFNLIGTIEEVDLYNMPSEDFFATGVDLREGQEVYAETEDNPLLIYVDVGDLYMPLYRESSLTDFEIADICRQYIMENSEDNVDSITNWDNPEIIHNSVLPEGYYVIENPEGDISDIIMVRFTTDSDALIGPIEIFIDSSGTIIGMNFRE